MDIERSFFQWVSYLYTRLITNRPSVKRLFVSPLASSFIMLAVVQILYNVPMFMYRNSLFLYCHWYILMEYDIRTPRSDQTKWNGITCVNNVRYATACVRKFEIKQKQSELFFTLYIIPYTLFYLQYEVNFISLV